MNLIDIVQRSSNKNEAAVMRGLDISNTNLNAPRASYELAKLTCLQLREIFVRVYVDFP
jgi:hypothetical protein